MSKRALHRFWIGTQPNPADRKQILVSKADAAAMPTRGDRSGRVAIVFDKITKRWVTVRRASCGLPDCFCAMEEVK